MNEKIDVLNELGEFTGDVATIDECHSTGYWHRAVYAFIVDKDLNVLLQKRSGNKKLWPGKWDVTVGGHVKSGEFGRQALIRECKEELGIDIEIKKYVYEVKGKDFVQHFFLIRRTAGEIGTGNPEEYDVNRKGGIQIPMFVSIDKLKSLNVVSPPIVSQFLEDYSNFGSNMDSTSKIIEDY